MSDTPIPSDQNLAKTSVEQPDTSETSASSQEDYSVNAESIQKIFDQEWAKEESAWKKWKQEEKKYNQEILIQYEKRLIKAKKAVAELGWAAPTTAWDTEIEECNKQIEKLRREINGPYFDTVREDQLLYQKRKQVRTQTQSNGQLDLEELSRWFEALVLRDKFFVITLSIFNGINYPDFKDINEILVAEISTNIREEDRERRTLNSYFSGSDPKRLDDCRAKIEPKDGETEQIIRFRDDGYSEAVFNMLRKQYRDLLLDLLPALRSVVQKHRYWEIRFWLALAVAEIGKIGFTRMQRQVLDSWASDKHAYVRASVGYPLAYLAENKSTRNDVRELLDVWSNPSWGGHPETWRYRWTVASTYKQIGLIGQDWAKDWAFEGLKKIANYNDIRLVDATIHSLVVLSLQGELEYTLSALRNWISEYCEKKPSKQIDRDIEPKYLTTILAFIRLSEIHTADPLAESTSQNDVENNKNYRIGNILSLMKESKATTGNVWQLAVDIGTSTFKFGLEDLFFSLITLWTKYASDIVEYQTTIKNLVTEVFVKLEARDKKLVWNLLRRWEKYSRDNDLANMATMARVEIRNRVL